MKQRLTIAMALCLTAMTAWAEQVTVLTKNTALVLEVTKGQQPKYVYYGAKLSAQELSTLKAPAANESKYGKI